MTKLEPNTDIQKNLNFDFFSTSDTDIDVGKYFIFLYNELPFNYSFSFSIDLDNFLKKLKKKYKLTEKNFILKGEIAKRNNINTIDYNKSYYLIRVSEKIILLLGSRKAEIFYSQTIKFSEIKKLIKLFECKKKEDKKIRQFSIIIHSNSTDSGYDLKSFDIIKSNMIIEDNFNDDFIEKHEEFLEHVNDDKKSGIILLHGKNGTGKTSYVKYLMNLVNKKFIFLHQSMFDAMQNPYFLMFLNENKDSILILEDCDSILTNNASDYKKIL